MHISLTPAANAPSRQVIYRQGVLIIDGQEMPPGDYALDYDEAGGCATGSDSPDCTFIVIPSTWVDPTLPPEPDPEAEALAALEAWRAGTVADAWQLAFVLGEVRWAALEAWADGYFNTRILVAKATVIPRASETVALMAWVLDMEPDEVDEVFRVAMGMRA